MTIFRVLIHSSIWKNDTYPEIPSDSLYAQLHHLADVIKQHHPKPVIEEYQLVSEQEFQQICRQIEQTFNQRYAPEKATFYESGVQLTPDSKLCCFGKTHYLQLECHPMVISLTKEEEANQTHENV